MHEPVYIYIYMYVYVMCICNMYRNTYVIYLRFIKVVVMTHLVIVFLCEGGAGAEVWGLGAVQGYVRP